MDKRNFYSEISDEELKNLFFKRNNFDSDKRKFILTEIESRGLYNIFLKKEEMRKNRTKRNVNRKNNHKLSILYLVIVFLVIGIFFLLSKFTEPIYTKGKSFISNKHTVPIQNPKFNKPPFNISLSEGELTFSPIAKYTLTGMVVSKKKYSFGWESEISPIDFAMAWGLLQEKEYLKSIKYKQRGRWYFYRYSKKFHIPEYISFNSANNHIIPATKNLKRAILKVRKKDIIKMEGYLVNIHGTYKSRTVWWNTSTSREDTGNGACEIFYITKLYNGNKVFE